MKRLLFAIVCASVLSGGVLSAEARPEYHDLDKRPRHEMRMREDLAAKLKLTDEQKALADKIREDGRLKMEPLMQERRTLHEKMETLRKQNMEEFEKILTPEQKEMFARLKQHRGEHPDMRPMPREDRGRHKGPAREHHPDEILPLADGTKPDAAVKK